MGCEGGKLAVIESGEDHAGDAVWRMVVAGMVIDEAYYREEYETIKARADRINAAVEAIVEARLDEITKGAN